MSHSVSMPRLPCPSPTPRACSNSCPSSWWFHPMISSSVILLSFCLQSFQHQDTFQWVSLWNQVAKYWSFSISLSSEYSGLISFRMYWLDLLAGQGTLKSLLKQHSWKSSILLHSVQSSSVQSLSRAQLFVTPWIAACQTSLSITNSQSSLGLTSIESVMPSSHLILCRPLLLLPPIPPSIRVSSNESTLHMRWLKYWSFSFSISPSKEIPGLMSFRMDWLDLLAVQGTFKSLLQHHSSKASILRCSAFFTVQLSHLHMTTGKTIALTRWTK